MCVWGGGGGRGEGVARELGIEEESSKIILLKSDQWVVEDWKKEEEPRRERERRETRLVL